MATDKTAGDLVCELTERLELLAHRVAQDRHIQALPPDSLALVIDSLLAFADAIDVLHAGAMEALVSAANTPATQTARSLLAAATAAASNQN